MKLDRRTALAMCERFSLPSAPNGHATRPHFYALSDVQRANVKACADFMGFKKPHNAIDERVSYFYGHLGRALARQT